MQHQSELERLLAADRDQLADDVKQLKTERKEKLEQVNMEIWSFHVVAVLENVSRNSLIFSC